MQPLKARARVLKVDASLIDSKDGGGVFVKTELTGGISMQGMMAVSDVPRVGQEFNITIEDATH
jgi:hypothetical protein